MKQHNAVFANFILRFGEDKELVDYAEDILIPALTSGQVRNYGNFTEYFIYRGRVATIGDDDGVLVVAIIGQFIKTTQLMRYQIFDRTQGLVADESSIASAPSAFFVLILNNHRLIYFPETPDAPDFTPFKATLKQFIADRHKEFIDELAEQNKKLHKKITKKALRELNPSPTLEIIPLTGVGTINSFVNRYALLKSIEFRIVKPNSEIEAGSIFQQLRDMSDAIGSSDTRLKTSNAEGLDKEQSKDAIAKATETGNQEINLLGQDADGNTLRGNNEAFQISAPISNVPKPKLTLAKRLYEVFTGLVNSGSIKTQKPKIKVIELVQRLSE